MWGRTPLSGLTGLTAELDKVGCFPGFHFACVACLIVAVAQQHLPDRRLPEELFAFSRREAARHLAQAPTIARAWGDGVVITPDDVLLRIATCHTLYHGAPSLSQLVVEFMAAANSADRGSDASSSSGRPRAFAGKCAMPPVTCLARQQSHRSAQLQWPAPLPLPRTLRRLLRLLLWPLQPLRLSPL
jgi:hypothetical protein